VKALARRSRPAAKTHFTTGEVARILGVTPVTVINYCTRGLLTATQSTLTRYRRVTRESLAEFLKSHGLPLDVLEQDTPRRVLIVDDEHDVRWAIRQVVERAAPGAAIAEASDGYSACLVAGSFAPDLITLDIQMPQMDGVQVCRALRAFETTRATRILVITAFLGRESREALAGLGADEIVAKPFRVADLTDKVARLLGKRSAAR
jgi:CheY-like chemotaxis protein